MDNKNIVCEICKQNFQTMLDLKQHILEVCGKRSKRTDVANALLEDISCLFRQIDDTHLSKRSKKPKLKQRPKMSKNDCTRLTCEICKKEFQTMQYLKTHVLNVCQQRPNGTNNQSNLRDDSWVGSNKSIAEVNTCVASDSGNTIYVAEIDTFDYKERNNETVNSNERIGKDIEINNEITSSNSVLTCNTTENGVVAHYNDTINYGDTLNCVETIDCRDNQSIDENVKCDNTKIGKTIERRVKKSFAKTAKCANTSVVIDKAKSNRKRLPMSQSCHQDTLESSCAQKSIFNQHIDTLPDDEHIYFKIQNNIIERNVVMKKDTTVSRNDAWNFYCLECKECFLDEDCLSKHDCTTVDNLKGKKELSFDNGHMMSNKNIKVNVIFELVSLKERKLISGKQTQLHCFDSQDEIVDEDGLLANKISHTVLLIECESCGRQINESTMLEHVRKHHSGCGFYCTVCRLRYKSKQSFRKHFVSKHLSETLCKHGRCETCDIQYDRLRKLLKRARCKHTAEQTRICHICGKQYHTCSGAFSLHLETHNLGRSRCDHCQRTFSSLGSLRMHIILHFGRETFECKTCNRSFGQFRYLKGHEKQVHTTERQYLCDRCGYGAVDMTKLREHMLLHSRIKQFRCTNCDAEFRWKTNLREHLRNGICKKTL